MPVIYDYDAYREIFVVFQDSDPYTGSFLFKKGFTHCFAIERQALGWLCIDPSRKDCLSHILPAGYLDEVMDTYVKQNRKSTVLQLFVSRHQDERLTYPKLGLISCVGIIQYNLGVYWPLIVTPYQLYCRLSSGQISHIRVGNVWLAEVQDEKLKTRRQHPERKLKTSGNKRPRYRKKLPVRN